MNQADDVRSGRDRQSAGIREATDTPELRLWFGVLGGPIAWLIHLLLSYGIAEFGCVSSFRETELAGITGVAWLEIVVSLLMVSVALVATVLAQRHKRYFAGELDAARLEPNDPRIFMARSGVLASGLFVFIIVVQALPVLYYLRDC